MKIKIYFLLVLVFCGGVYSVRANFGESFDQVNARYGPPATRLPAAMMEDPAIAGYVYKFNQRDIYVLFLDGKSCSETVRAPKDGPHFTEQTFLAIATTISSATGWTLMSSNEFAVEWWGSNTTVVLRHIEGRPDLLYVDSAKMNAHLLGKSNAKEVGTVNEKSLGGGRHSKETVIASQAEETSLPVYDFSVGGDGRRYAYALRLFHSEIRDELVKLADSDDSSAPAVAANLSQVISNSEVGAAQVSCDGQSQKYYYNVQPPLLFSPDGNHLAYVASDPKHSWVVLDGVDQPHQYTDIRSLTFSPGNRLAYIGADHEKDSSSEHNYIVIDGDERETPGDLVDDAISGRAGSFSVDLDEEPARILFSHDGAHFAYVVNKRGKAEVSMVRDGKEIRSFDDVVAHSMLFSPDGSRLAFAAHHGERMVLVVDDKEQAVSTKRGKTHHDIKYLTVTFSPDGKHLAYVMRMNGNRDCVCLDGKEGKYYPSIVGVPVFSPDSQHLAYFAQLPKSSVRKSGPISRIVVFDDQEQTNAVAEGSRLWFSPDSQRLAYLGLDVGQPRLVVDGAFANACPGVAEFCFSPDSRHYACITKIERGGTPSLIIDNSSHSLKGQATWLHFTPDSRHCLCELKPDGSFESTILADGHPGRYYSEIYLPEKNSSRPDDNAVRYYGKRDSLYYFNEETFDDAGGR